MTTGHLLRCFMPQETCNQLQPVHQHTHRAGHLLPNQGESDPQRLHPAAAPLLGQGVLTEVSLPTSSLCVNSDPFKPEQRPAVTWEEHDARLPK